MAQRWDRVQELFDELASLGPNERAERVGLISESDPELHAEVLALLSADERASELLSPLEHVVSLAGLGGRVESEVSLAHVTTSSYPALLAYLEGEQLFRRARFREAIPAFTRAIDPDSLFMMGHIQNRPNFRLGRRIFVPRPVLLR